MPAGRPSKYSPLTTQTILDALEEGLPRRFACALAGISQDSLARWLDKYADFATAVAKSEAIAVQQALATIRRAGDDGSWQARAWQLERTHPQEFGRLDRLQIDVELRREAERIAIANGLDPNEVLVEAQRMLKASK